MKHLFAWVLALTVVTMAGVAGAASAAATTGSKPQATAAPAVGIVDSPCTYESGLKAAAGIGSWNQWLRTHDFGDLCHYESANAELKHSMEDAPGVVFMGDSITEIWRQKAPGFFTHGRIDRGISGQTTSQMLLRFRQDVIDLHPVAVHILGGINDIAGNTGPVSLRRIESNLADMAELARAHGIKVILASVLPANAIPWNKSIHPSPAIIALNQWIRKYTTDHHFVYVDYYAAMKASDGAMRGGLSSDGVHPTARGFKIMDPLAIKAINEALRQSGE